MRSQSLTEAAADADLEDQPTSTGRGSPSGLSRPFHTSALSRGRYQALPARRDRKGRGYVLRGAVSNLRSEAGGHAADRRRAGDARKALSRRDHDRDLAEGRFSDGALRLPRRLELQALRRRAAAGDRTAAARPGDTATRSARRPARRVAGSAALRHAGGRGNGRDAGLSAGPVAQRLAAVHARGPDRAAAEIGPTRGRPHRQPFRSELEQSALCRAGGPADRPAAAQRILRRRDDAAGRPGDGGSDDAASGRDRDAAIGIRSTACR